jgi:hypothetical protein
MGAVQPKPASDAIWDEEGVLLRTCGFARPRSDADARSESTTQGTSFQSVMVGHERRLVGLKLAWKPHDSQRFGIPVQPVAPLILPDPEPRRADGRASRDKMWPQMCVKV